MPLNQAQEAAIQARGNVLVIAGAGTGKTRTLVERCVRILIEEKPPVSMDEILMVTFTEAAAAEMRQRIRARLEEEAAKQRDGRWREQLALFDTACIGTLHSFCLRLVREHFYELELDPQLSVLAEEDAGILASQTLEALLEDYYGEDHPLSESFQNLVQEQGQGSDKDVRHLLLKVYRYAQSLPDGAGWIRHQIDLLSSPKADLWHEWLPPAFEDWRNRWIPSLARAASENGAAASSLAALEALAGPFSAPRAREALSSIVAAFAHCPHRKKTVWNKPFKPFLAEAEFLSTLMPRDGQADPLQEDWDWVRGHMATLLRAAAEFGERYFAAKRDLGLVDFQDLEQHAIRLLWDFKTGQPTQIAVQWRDRLRFIFVDEYQDINAAQDKVIEAISRPGANANRFLVGDVKQSIYRFRLANPAIFQEYARTWRGKRGTAIPLRENFRSREGILDFANALFNLVMRPELGGVAYDAEAQLKAGQPCKFVDATRAGAARIPVELHLRFKPNGPREEANGTDDATADTPELEEADKEAQLVALRLRQLHAGEYPVWDDSAETFRPVQWKDMAILLRSPSGKAESYAKVFGSLGVPLLVERGGFYNSSEISDLLSVLEILDNPLQDIPALAVLRSPLVGLNASELATIRLAGRRTRYWTALVRWHNAPNDAALFSKVDAFLLRYRRWRKLARHVSLSRCLETILAETHYSAWLLTQPRGELRHANVKRLLALARRFDQFQKQGLFRFLRYLEGQRSTEAEPASAVVTQSDAVRLMSVHQSKGLEFPIVASPDLGKPFNFSDLREQVILDERHGLCPHVRPPQSGSTYPSLAYWLARARQTRELLGEELRLFYVAVTRARDLLLLVGSIPETKFERALAETSSLTPQDLARVGCWADWVLQWFSRNCTQSPSSHPDLPLLAWATKDQAIVVPDEGETALIRWRLYREEPEVDRSAPPAITAAAPAVFDEIAWRAIQQKLSTPYPFVPATRHPAKTSVTSLRRAAIDTDAAVPRHPRRSAPATRSPDPARLSATEIGNAHHAFLKAVSLEAVGSAAELMREAERLRRTAALSEEEVNALDFPALARFWNSELGRKLREGRKYARRELAFTVRIAADELARLTGARAAPESAPHDESVIVQGVADLAVFAPDGLILVDFKTDQVNAAGVAALAEQYSPQVRLYALALSRIYSRPVASCWLYFLRPGQAVEVPFPEEVH